MQRISASRIMLAGIAGTSSMTLYSYLLSYMRRENFREPALLANMIKKSFPVISRSGALVTGWVVHYFVGVFFSALYSIPDRKNMIQNAVLKSMLIGTATGVFGIAVWKQTFSMHSDPPQTAYKNFYNQLLIGHIIFAVISIMILRSKPGKRDCQTKVTRRRTHDYKPIIY